MKAVGDPREVVSDPEARNFGGRVELVDRDAVRLLALHEAKNIELRHCPAYIREWVTRERAGS